MLELLALPGLPMVQPGDDLPALLAEAIARAGITPREGDVLVVAQKIVSKAEGRYVDLAVVEPSPTAHELAATAQKDPRFVEVVLRESRRVVRCRPGVLIVEHRLGYVMANAGIDRSNLPPDGEGHEHVLLLPADPDAAAKSLRSALQSLLGVTLAVVINDSFGRAWRRGTVGVALGAAGLPALIDRRGAPDLFGRALQVTEIGHADEIAAAASLLMGQADEARPAVLLRGLALTAPARPARDLLRPESEDMFR
jgi:coenzyme F420-0:L-glutamate ligase/coenzyme F420-1:gamma-L-glutamate ligase